MSSDPGPPEGRSRSPVSGGDGHRHRLRRLLHWLAIHPGSQAAGVALALVLCVTVFLATVPGAPGVGIRYSLPESRPVAVPQRQIESAPSTQPSSVALPVAVPTTTTTSRPEQQAQRITIPMVSTNPTPDSQTTQSGGGAGEQVHSVAPGAPATASLIVQGVDPTLVDIDASLSGGMEGFGTGIVLTSSGEILTNDHVVSGATQLSATDVGNGQTYGAQLVGADQGADLAVLQLEGASGLQAASLGESNSLVPGEGVVAVGDANDAGGTPSYAGGSVTALHQNIIEQDDAGGWTQPLGGLIETDTPLLPGDSGGPLVDPGGEVVGVDTAFAADISCGYAIPIDKALAVVTQIVG